MKTYQKYLFPLLLLIPPSSVFAGFMEVGASGNYRISKINSNNYQEMVSYTGSLSYYFWEMSAMELSYTQGNQVVVLQIPSDNKTTTTTFFELIGLDLVITLADKQSDFQPYVKMGGAYIKKEIVRTIESLGSDRIDSPAGLVPSAGVGFRIKLSNNFSIKAGVDAWTSPLKQNPVTIDYAGRAGVSFLF